MNDLFIDVINNDIEVNLNGNIIATGGTVSNIEVIDCALIAGESIGGHKIIYEKNKKAYIASIDNLECIGKVIGMSLNAADMNDTINIRRFGNIQNQNWGLTANTNYFLGINGAISTNAGNGLFSQCIGFSADTENLQININNLFIRI
jgi:hypothetical protein